MIEPFADHQGGASLSMLLSYFFFFSLSLLIAPRFQQVLYLDTVQVRNNFRSQMLFKITMT
jgi:hypothetical protein